MRSHSTGVLYILKDKLQIYSTLLPDLLEYQFQPQSIDNLNIANKELLTTDIMRFVSENNISPCNLIIVIADNASHIKAMTHDQPEEEQTKNFMTTAPFFPHLVTKTIATPNGTCLYGVNYDLCESIKEAFEKVGFSIDFVLPALAFGNDFSDKEKVLALIPQGAEVMTMTSITLEESGIADEINTSEKYISVRKQLSTMDRRTHNREMQKLGAAPDWAIGSVHAVTESGEVLIASNTGSQISAYVYGSGHVVWVVGAQKIVKNIDEGMQRITEYIVPKETERARKAYNLPEFNTNVSKLLIVNKETFPGRIHIIFVNEALGY